jgi:hypothetical protein
MRGRRLPARTHHCYSIPPLVGSYLLVLGFQRTIGYQCYGIPRYADHILGSNEWGPLDNENVTFFSICPRLTWMLMDHFVWDWCITPPEKAFRAWQQLNVTLRCEDVYCLPGHTIDSIPPLVLGSSLLVPGFQRAIVYQFYGMTWYADHFVGSNTWGHWYRNECNGMLVPSNPRRRLCTIIRFSFGNPG